MRMNFYNEKEQLKKEFEEEINTMKQNQREKIKVLISKNDKEERKLADINLELVTKNEEAERRLEKMQKEHEIEISELKSKNYKEIRNLKKSLNDSSEADLLVDSKKEELDEMKSEFEKQKKLYKLYLKMSSIN